MGRSVDRFLLRVRRDASGMSMVEMMVALLVLGVVLSAFASVIVTSLRAMVAAEREVQATALAQQEIERFQTIDWEQVALYQDEIDAAATAWSEVLDASAELSAAELAVLPAAGTSADRAAQVQAPVATDTRANVDYTVLRYVTWVDRSEDTIEDTKRLHVVVRWTTLTGQRQVVATGERSPTQGESPASEEGVRVLSFTRSPDPSFLDGDGRLADPVTVRVRFNRGIQNGQLRYFVPDDVDDHDGTADSYRIVSRVGSGTLPDPANGFPTAWEFTVEPGDDAFVPGTVPLQFVGQVPFGDAYETESALILRSILEPAEDEPPIVEFTYPPPPSGGGSTPTSEVPPPTTVPDGPVDPTSVEIKASTSIPTQMCVQGNSGSLKSALTVDVSTKGLADTDLVKVEYLYWSGNGSNARQNLASVDVGHVGGVTSSRTWKGTIPASAAEEFVRGETVEFRIEARRSSDSDGKNADFIVSKVVAQC